MNIMNNCKCAFTCSRLQFNWN